MIKYALLCAEEHEFEGWFRDSQDFDVQANDGLIECPLCGCLLYTSPSPRDS